MDFKIVALIPISVKLDELRGFWDTCLELGMKVPESITNFYDNTIEENSEFYEIILSYKIESDGTIFIDELPDNITGIKIKVSK